MKSTSNRHKKQPKNTAKTASFNQVRIVGGHLKRRNINFIDLEGLRPTPDRLRETLFNWLMYDIKEANVLDACAGSGVLGFEAISRGASHATFIEANKTQWQLLAKTANELKISAKQTQILHGKAEMVLTNTSFHSYQPFDLVFLDPPYSLDLWLPIIQTLDKQKLITNNTLIYIEAGRPIESIFTNTDYQENIEIIKTKKMGQVYAGLIQVDTSTKS